ncbi:hypothetical protein [Rhizobium sp. BK251]|uniref:hypothetical protein n=1 Tax=Rhizobium sp. BK251 TaxID=2512125 RepID=UPI0010512E71|nr:hypothetical protein [Rhizobium sp. BK251]TCL70539.1 hypothetical protein EV286_107414 [Rhizobium sp. BK251]
MYSQGLEFDALAGIDPNTGVARYAAETQVFPIFYRGSKRDNFSSQEAGYPIEKGVDMVEIRQAGERDTTKREVTGTDKARWPRHWAAYQAGQEQTQDGTPLDLLFPKNPEIVATLRANNIHTIQSLAGVPDSTTLPFIKEHRQKAQIFLEGIDKGKGFHALEKKLEEAEFRNRDLEQRLAEMEARLSDAGGEEQKRGPGRPRSTQGD